MIMRSKYTILSTLLILVFLTACSTAEFKTVEQKYDQAIQHIDKGNYSLAEPILKEIIEETPGTRYATFAYLKLGDTLMESGQSKYDEAETNFRIFLRYSPYSHLVPYVLSRLIELNFKRNTSIFFGLDYAYSRDPEHFKKIVTEYQRFYLIYPNSFYLEDVGEYLIKSNEALAYHEILIGDWYFKHELYSSAIARYRYMLDNYSSSSYQKEGFQKLIKAYDKNLQPDLAKEFTQVFEKTFQSNQIIEN